MNRTKSAFIGAISSQVFTISAILLNLATTPFILHHLNSSIYGLSIIIFQITTYLGMFDFGLTAGVERFLAGTREDSEESKNRIQKIISTSFIVYALMGLIVVVIGSVFAPFAAEIFDIPAGFSKSVHYIIISLSFLVGFQFLLRAVSGIFFAHQKQFLSNSLSFALNISNILFTVLFVYLGYELWSFVFAQVLVFLFNSILTLYFFNKHYGYVKFTTKDFEFSLLKEMFSYGFYLFIIGVAVQIVFQTDRVVIGSIVSLSAVSVYALTSKLPEMSSQLIWKITDNSFPGMVELSKGAEINPFRKIHDKLMGLTLSLSTTAFWIIAIMTAPFINLWIGKNFFAGQDFVFLICYLYLVQLTFIHVSSMCLNGAGIAKQLSFMSILEAILNLGISIYLTKLMGLKGVLFGTIIAGLLTSVWYVPYLTSKFMKISIKEYLISLLKPILFCSIFDVVIFFLFRNIFSQISSWFYLMLYSMIFSILVAIPMVWYNWSFIKDVKSKLFTKGAG
ncbi:O-antigen/teichoic acid export membrane protein [Pedobacter sp. UYP24]